MQDYGAYLEADAIAAAASCRELEWALQEAFRLAEQCSDYKSNERCVLADPFPSRVHTQRSHASVTPVLCCYGG